MIYPANFEQKIGFDRLREQVAARCTMRAARARLAGETFSTSAREIARRLTLADEMRLLLDMEHEFPGGEYPDVDHIVAKLRVEGSFLDVEEVVTLHRALTVVGGIVAFILNREEQYPALHARSRGVAAFPEIVQRIDAIVDRFGNVKDNASPGLLEIRRAVREREGQAAKRLQAVLSAAKNAGIVDADAQISIREGKAVIPVAAANKRKLQGFIHDESATGRTFYVEPVEVVEINNELRELEYAERREIVRILSEFTDSVRPDAELIADSGDYLAEIDMLRAKGRWASENGCVKPIVSTDDRLVLKNARVINVFTNEIEQADVAIRQGVILGVGHYTGETELDLQGKYVCPGLVDGHIHIESSMLCGPAFEQAVLPHGTTAVVTDPHEISNVAGTAGLDFMLETTKDLALSVYFMLPSCVPATPLDESGAVLDYRAIDSFYEHNRVEGLAEMMNYVGVANADEQVLEKIVAAQAHHKKIDGHAPGLSGNDLNAYIAAGVYSDHECSTVEDAIAKLERGQYIMIREGTAARNLDALLPLLTPQYYTYCMFCTDDKHPNDLLEKGHIDYIVRRAIKSGVDPIIAVKCASHHAARYFLLNNRGAIAPGFLADFVVIDNFDDFNILEVYKKGKLMFDGKTVTPFEAPEIDPHLVKRSHETFHVAHLEATDFIESRPRAVLGMVPGEIVTTDAGYAEKISVEDDILKIAVIERHKNTHHIGIGYIRGYGLKSGAVATSISHDSHNIIVVGANEEDMAAAVNRVVELGGGIVVMDDGKVLGELQLQIAGIMSEAPLIEVNEALENAKEQAFKLGVSRGVDPFMTLSFMALTVIPTLRLTTRGVFDVINQRYV